MAVTEYFNFGADIIAGYTTDFAGDYGYNMAKDVPHYEALAARYGMTAEQLVRVNQKHTDRVLRVDMTNGGEGILRGGRRCADAACDPAATSPGTVAGVACDPAATTPGTPSGAACDDTAATASGTPTDAACGMLSRSCDSTGRPLNSEYVPHDALITDTRGLMLCVVTADCVPILFYDPVRQAIGAAHSGRRGCFKEIALQTVKKMGEAYGSNPGDIRCLLGPYLSQTHHEVNAWDVEEAYAHFNEAECETFIQSRGEKRYVDMGTAIRISLMRAGVSEEHITDNHVCTYEHEELYSWRRDHGPKCNILTYIALR